MGSGASVTEIAHGGAICHVKIPNKKPWTTRCMPPRIQFPPDFTPAPLSFADFLGPVNPPSELPSGTSNIASLQR